MVDTDRRFVETMDAALPRGAMVFEFPPTKFPETGRVGLMADYEHLVPYLLGSQLRYSYGTDKGRARETWQDAVASLGPRELAEALEAYGFSAILIDRRALDHLGTPTSSTDFSPRAGKSSPTSAAGRVALRLDPARTPRLPDTPPLFGRSWLGSPLGETRWSRGEDGLVVRSTTRVDPARSAHFSFTLFAPDSRLVTLRRGTATIAEWTVGAEGRAGLASAHAGARRNAADVRHRAGRAATHGRWKAETRAVRAGWRQAGGWREKQDARHERRGCGGRDLDLHCRAGLPGRAHAGEP